MKLGPNMYVRTNKGEIAKIVADNPYLVNIDKFKKDGITLRTLRKIDILKASYNIIDVLEVGDVVTFKNDEDVYKINCVPNEESACDCFYLVFDYATQYGLEDIEVSKETMLNTLESVITREQFSQIAYKVGD